jgi:DNA polymerase-3 subunit delta'
MPWGLIGLDKVKMTLSDMLKNSHLPHALLFCGPFGSGKFSLAVALAQAINCQKPDTDLSPCQVCTSCRKIKEGVHPDITIIAPSGKQYIIPIEEVRELRESLSFRPFEGKLKVAIIREAERFKQEAGGALLKTLEEPTPDTILILTADSESSVMETLVSRCVRVKFAPLSRNQIIEALQRKGFDLRSSYLLAGLSGGALGSALNIDPLQALTFWDRIDKIFGQPNRIQYLKAAFSWTQELIAEQVTMEKREEDPESKLSFYTLVLNIFRLWWRDVMVLAATSDQDRMFVPPPTISQTNWSQKITARMIGRLNQAIGRLDDGLGRSMRPVLLFENYWLDVLEYM